MHKIIKICNIGQKMKPRYARTTVKEKRNMVRSLNTFFCQYDSAFIEDAKMNASGQIVFDKPIKIFFEETNLYKLGIFKNGSGMIYNKDVTLNELSDYNILINAVDDLISINRKLQYKKSLLGIIDNYTIKKGDSSEWITNFFHKQNKEKILSMITTEISQSEKRLVKKRNKQPQAQRDI